LIGTSNRERERERVQALLARADIREVQEKRGGGEGAKKVTPSEDIDCSLSFSIFFFL
jgi:hypothetical protein